MQARINLRYLHACSLAASTEDTRFYLKGVCVEIQPRATTYVATDGHKLICAHYELDKDAEDNTLKGAFIVPTEICRVYKPKKGWNDAAIDFAYMAQGGVAERDTFRLGDRIFKPIDGTFPDWRRVLPRGNERKEGDKRVTQFNLDYLATLKKAGDMMGASCTTIRDNDPGNPHLITFGTAVHAFAVCMPMRGDYADVDPPSWVNRKPEAANESTEKNEAA